MASVTACAARAIAASSPQEQDREKAFFETWLRLMERQKDAAGLTQALQRVLTQSADVTANLQDARHQANLLSANAKTLSELVATLNDFFFRDIVPALKRARTMGPNGSSVTAQDPLDRYLERGDETTTMPQAFVDDMSGWEAPNGQETTRETPDRTDGGDDQPSDDEISSEMFHDLLISNSLKFTAMQAQDYSAMIQRRAIQQQAAGQTTDAAAPNAAAIGKRARIVPPPIVTNLSPRAAPRTASTPRTQSRSPDAVNKKDRIGKQAAASLVAEIVLGVRTYGKAKEYLMRWQGVSVPLWIARRKAPAHAKELIDQYVAELRARDNALANQRETGKSRKGNKKKGTSERGATGGGMEFYTVDHIVNHRMLSGKRQYLVRWESYDESEDTWENADKLRVDVPDIVNAYEEKLQRTSVRAEVVHLAMSELNRDGAAGSKSTSKKRKTGKSKVQLPVRGSQADGEHGKEKRRRISVGDGEDKNCENDGGNTSEDDYLFHLEEAELEEFTENEFSDKLNN
ncbi:hypothetical protein PRIC1_005091 [Phytophthora ramorum]